MLVKVPFFPELENLQLSEWAIDMLIAVLPVFCGAGTVHPLPRLGSLSLSNEDRTRSYTPPELVGLFYQRLFTALHLRGAGVEDRFNLDLSGLSFITSDLMHGPVANGVNEIFSKIHDRQITIRQNDRYYDELWYARD
jgi:hypothetical protein